MVTHNMYGDAPRRAFASTLSNLGDVGTTVRCALLAPTHTPDTSTHDAWGDVMVDEVTGTGYTAGGTELTNKTLTRTGATTTFNADDAVWTASTISAGYAVVYDATPAADADKSLLTLVNFEGTQSSDNGEFRVQWAASGIFTVTV